MCIVFPRVLFCEFPQILLCLFVIPTLSLFVISTLSFCDFLICDFVVCDLLLCLFAIPASSCGVLCSLHWKSSDCSLFASIDFLPRYFPHHCHGAGALVWLLTSCPVQDSCSSGSRHLFFTYLLGSPRNSRGTDAQVSEPRFTPGDLCSFFYFFPWTGQCRGHAFFWCLYHYVGLDSPRRKVATGLSVAKQRKEDKCEDEENRNIRNKGVV